MPRAVDVKRRRETTQRIRSQRVSVDDARHLAGRETATDVVLGLGRATSRRDGGVASVLLLDARDHGVEACVIGLVVFMPRVLIRTGLVASGDVRVRSLVAGAVARPGPPITPAGV